jgi:hypothetical protein
MSMVVIGKLNRSIILVADRRAVKNPKVFDGKLIQELAHYYDGARKIYLLSSPHNFLAVSAHGGEADGFDLTSLLLDFEKVLTPQRLSIEQYAERLSAFLNPHFSNSTGSTHRPDPGIFDVVGYDQGNTTPRHYRFELPITGTSSFLEGPVNFEGDPNAIDPTVLASALGEIANVVFARLKDKAQNVPLSNPEKTFLSQRNGDPLEVMTEEEFIQFGKTSVQRVSQRLEHLDVVQTVGSEVDVIVITPSDGVRAIEYGDDHQVLSNSDTATHFLAITCCGIKTKFQFDIEKSIRTGYLAFPEEFVCGKCGYRMALSRDEFLREKLK